MGETRIFDEGVRERDLDHFLIEELQADAGLRGWLAAQLEHVFDAPEGTTIRVGKSSQRAMDGRQTDVRIEYLDASGVVRAAILIENKITDGFQDGQAESYAAEVARLRQMLGAHRAASVLVAPLANPLSRGDSRFDLTIALERLSERLQHRLRDAALHEELRARLEVRSELLDALCGKRGGSRWAPVTVPAKRDFAMAYAELAREVVPNLTVRPSIDGPRAVTRFFEGFAGQDSMPMKVRLKHEFGNGREPTKYVNLQFDGAAACEELFRASRDLLPTDGSIFVIRSGGSLMVRIRTPGIVPDPDRLESQRSALLDGLRGIRRLADWMAEHHQQVGAILAGRP